ncbi:5'-nucleotidase domain-containing protein 1 [Neocloeon triangulifer]|uniref:5'-nucleotidase domain-containing protein 1 n=1 Tax=Neocloeon triangulifer TaxID=2078957 RepID=UPI00286ED63A|nr:5'-nucleotidase domain-containing protein 1 [Neocloeon triangulifer]
MRALLFSSRCNLLFFASIRDSPVFLHRPARHSFVTTSQPAMEISGSAGGPGRPIPSHFNLADYNCVGFDLDNTICRYQLTNMVQLEYDALCKFLVDQKGYSSKVLQIPIDFEFLQKGLTLDFEKGNTLRISGNGTIWRAAHGTKFLTDEEIETQYGVERTWEPATALYNEPLATWNGPVALKLRSLLDYFDMPAALAFARLVDDYDEKNGGPKKIPKVPGSIWSDILDGLSYMFSRHNFAAKDGGHYFGNLRSYPEKYLNRCPPEAIEWLKSLKKQNKKLFMLTGSHIDFANYTSTYCLGPDWRELFDIVVSFAKKPGFFSSNRPFLSLKNYQEGDPIDDLTKLADKNFVSVSQGNWQELMEFLQIKLKGDTPKCLYVGDNVVQDLYAPFHFTRCDTLAVIEELWGENNLEPPHPDLKVLLAKDWGSYFGTRKTPSLWHNFITKSALLTVPNFESFAKLPLDKPIPTGFYPEEPVSFVEK